MITKLNLSTHPFRNRTTPYLLALGLLALGAIGGIFALSQLYSYSKDNELARKQVEQMEAEVARLKNEGAKVQQSLSPEQR
ncbi:MAG TPA: hypothetical protein PLK77_19365, partial [Pyrinomonadaceae bacterium]|nr:hypothetical protein [Pyrinomonadaceae bacterium]